MAQVTISASAIVQAPPEIAYGILIDYHQAHSAILPRPPFGELVVEKGGTGAGTIFRVTSREGLRMRTYRMEASEPNPGRLLVETDLESDLVTHFAVDPVEGGHARVTITTRYTRPGVKGAIERVLLPVLAGPIYRKEIANMEALARQRVAAAPAG